MGLPVGTDMQANDDKNTRAKNHGSWKKHTQLLVGPVACKEIVVRGLAASSGCLRDSQSNTQSMSRRNTTVVPYNSSNPAAYTQCKVAGKPPSLTDPVYKHDDTGVSRKVLHCRSAGHA